MECQDIIVIPELKIMFVRFELVFIEYSLAEDRETDLASYKPIHLMHDSELFVGDQARERYEQEIKAQNIKGGFGACKHNIDPSDEFKKTTPDELAWCWLDFQNKPYQEGRTSQVKPSHKILSAFRINVGHITDVKVFWTYENITHDGTLSFLSKCEMARTGCPHTPITQQTSGKVRDVFACVVSNDGYIRVYSLTSHTFVSVCRYFDGGINSFNLSFDRSHALLALQDDSIILYNLTLNRCVKFNLHNNFVTHSSFFDQLNKEKRTNGDKDWD
jgi:hypothetical protein